MALIDELERLNALHASGGLNDDEFARAKAKLLEGAAAPIPAVAAINRFRRSRHDRWVAGVCGGLGAVTGVESWVWRLLLLLLAVYGGAGVLVYLLAWLFVPEE